MKRVIVQFRLSPAQQFKMKIREPGIIHQFGMGYEAPSMLLSSKEPVMIEYPFMLVELDPDGESRERSFAICSNQQIIEAPELRYVGSTGSEAQKTLLHLFEVIEPVQQADCPCHGEPRTCSLHAFLEPDSGCECSCKNKET